MLFQPHRLCSVDQSDDKVHRSESRQEFERTIVAYVYLPGKQGTAVKDEGSQ